MKYEYKELHIVDVARVEITVPVRYDEEDMPNDYPFRHGDVWKIIVDANTGEIRDFPKDAKYDKDLYMKVCDEGTYVLKSASGFDLFADPNHYVPAFVPNEYGDYIDFKIKNGVITNWKSDINVNHGE
jgi:hypothetical protein